MNYFIQGDAANADRIKAAFEKLGYEKVNVIHIGDYANERLFFFTENGKVRSTLKDCGIVNIIKTHPDYQELMLPPIIEHKFKVGDWIIHNGNGGHPVLITDDSERYGYGIQEGGGSYHLSHSLVDNEYRLWTIQDASNGDILVNAAINEIFIYAHRKQLYSIVCSHCHVRNCIFYLDGEFSYEHVHPATKEQHNLLFQEMKKAGYEWDADKKELRKIIEQKFKVGDNIKTGNTIETIAEISNILHRYYCESGRTISFYNQDLWQLVPKSHYDISNFHAGMPVLIRDDDEKEWHYSTYSHYTCRYGIYKFRTSSSVGFVQCIPFDGNEHLVGTTKPCDEQYINW